jgi:pyruvate dehydrogenase E2 component (dihydrolipoamide acetyltransferase)
VSANKGQTRIEEPTRAQRTIARRAAESRATVPHLELAADVDMAACLALGPTISRTAMLVKACALALRAVPRANGAYRDGRFELYSRVNVAVPVPADGAYVLATVFDAERKALPELTVEIAGLRGRALTPPELSGATFTLWEVEEVASASPVVVPPQAAALGAGAIRAEPLLRSGAIVPGHSMTVTLACDHRILYGQEAAAFLIAVRTRLETAAL